MPTRAKITKRPVLEITDDFETWKNKINSMVDYVDDNLRQLLLDRADEVISDTFDDRVFRMNMLLEEEDGLDGVKFKQTPSKIVDSFNSDRDVLTVPNVDAVEDYVGNITSELNNKLNNKLDDLSDRTDTALENLRNNITDRISESEESTQEYVNTQTSNLQSSVNSQITTLTNKVNAVQTSAISRGDLFYLTLSYNQTGKLPAGGTWYVSEGMPQLKSGTQRESNQVTQLKGTSVIQWAVKAGGTSFTNNIDIDYNGPYTKTIFAIKIA